MKVAGPPRRLEALTVRESMRLLSSVTLGRVVFTARALPAVRPAEHLGWSVTVVGVARQVTDPGEAAPYRRALRPWVAGDEDQVIAIHADLVTGFRLVPDPGVAGPGA
jgi:hypothetical protein